VLKIQSLDKAISILNCFSVEKHVLGVGDISKMTGYTPSTVSRLLSTLEKRGVLERAQGYGKYQLGYRIYQWGLLCQKQSNLATFARPVMEKLRDHCGEEVSLFVIADGHRTCLDHVPSKHGIAMVSPLGGKLPLHAGASGQVLLAFMPEEKRKSIVSKENLECFTDKTIIDPDALEEKLKQIRIKGYGISKEEREPGAFSIVAPIRDASEQVIASLGVAGPLYRINDTVMEEYINAVLQAAEEISNKVGFFGN
jgi:DNA-binding IclR family transcriptional regulator